MSLRTLAKQILTSRGLNAKKHLSQNFLVDKGVYDSIIASADISKDDTVIEIGPGLGFLTLELIKKAKHVLAIEIDPDMASIMEDVANVTDNLTIYNQDILKTNIPELLIEHKAQTYKVVANIPYHLTSKIVRLFLSAEKKPDRMVLLVQKEVAERALEQAGSHSLLSISVQLYSRPEIVRLVSKNSFHPQPKVDSAVLLLNIHDTYTSQIDDEIFFWRVVKAGFSAKRKKLVSTVSAGLQIEKDIVAKAIADLHLPEGVRPQHLSIENWLGLYRILKK